MLTSKAEGREVKDLTISCDQDDARFLLESMREYIAELEELAAPGAIGQMAMQFASSEPLPPDADA